MNNCFKSTSIIKVVTMENTDNSLGTISFTQRKPSHATTKLMLFKDEWNTKEDSGKSLRNALDIPKGTSRVESMSNSEKNQARSLSCYCVTLV